MATKGSILVLGAGLVTKPLVHYLSSHGWHVILASRTLENAAKLIDGAAHAEAHQFDINSSDHAVLDAWTEKSVAVISMLPYVRGGRPGMFFLLFFARLICLATMLPLLDLPRCSCQDRYQAQEAFLDNVIRQRRHASPRAGSEGCGHRYAK